MLLANFRRRGWESVTDNIFCVGKYERCERYLCVPQSSNQQHVVMERGQDICDKKLRRNGLQTLCTSLLQPSRKETEGNRIWNTKYIAYPFLLRRRRTTHLESVQTLLRDEAKPVDIDRVFNVVLAFHPCETWGQYETTINIRWNYNEHEVRVSTHTNGRRRHKRRTVITSWRPRPTAKHMKTIAGFL